MTITITHHRTVEEIEEYALEFDLLECRGAGYSFPCNKHGAVDIATLNPGARENLNKCLTGEYKVGPSFIRDLSRSYVVEPMGRCSCGGEAFHSRYCGVLVCERCNDHQGLVRCYCGWSASGGDGRRELVEMGETL